MKMHPLYPLTFRPFYKNTYWGGNHIAEQFNRPHTPIPCAESWELCGLEASPSIVAHGAFEGCSLCELVQTFGRDLVGTKAPNPEQFPLLFKIIDVQQQRALQVHPNEAVAQALGVQPKHELNYILKTYGASELLAGVRPGPDQLEGLTNRIYRHETHAGDLFDIPPGVVHAIGKGNLVLQVQQTSEVAYRVDDWDRGRTLHPTEALQSIQWRATSGIFPEPPPSSRDLRPRVVTPHFTFATLDLHRVRTLRTTGHSFMVLFCATGKASLGHDGPHPLTLLPGDLVLLPPQQYVTVSPLAEKTRLLVTTL